MDTDITKVQKERKELLLETVSPHSSTSRHSSRSGKSVQPNASSASTNAIKARATTEAARARAKYAQKEAVIERARIEEEEHTAAAKAAATTVRKRAELDTTLEALSKKEDAAATITQAEVLEAAVQLDGGEQKYDLTPTEGPGSHTADYTRSLLRFNTGALSQCSEGDTSDTKDLLYPREDAVPPRILSAWDISSQRNHSHASKFMDAAQLAHHVAALTQRNTAIHTAQQSSNTCIKEEAITRLFQGTTAEQDQHTNVSGLTDMWKYMIRHDMVQTVLTNFDDRPENYRI